MKESSGGQGEVSRQTNPVCLLVHLPSWEPPSGRSVGGSGHSPTVRPPRPCSPPGRPARRPGPTLPGPGVAVPGWAAGTQRGPRPRRGRGRCTHLALLHGHGLPAGRDLLIDAGQEVLRDAERVLQQRVVRVAGGRVLQQVLCQGKGRVRAADALGGVRTWGRPSDCRDTWRSTMPGGGPEQSPQANAVCTLLRGAPRCGSGAGSSSQGVEALGRGSPVPCRRLVPSLASAGSKPVLPTCVWRCQAKPPLDVFRVHLDHPGALVCARSGESPQPS